MNVPLESRKLEESRNYDVQYTHDPDGLKQYNKKNMTLSMPDLSALNDNIPAQLHFSYGCQMVCMNMQNNDDNLQFYNGFFESCDV